MKSNDLTDNRDFAAHYEENYHTLYRLAFRIIGNKSDTEDALQESYLQAYQAYPTFNHRSKVSTWLYTITVRCCLKFIKQRRQMPIVEITHQAGLSVEAFYDRLKTYPSAEDEAMVNNVREVCLQMFFNCIPRKQKICFTLQVLLQLPLKETAAILGTSPGAVKVNVHRAKTHLKGVLEGHCGLLDPNNRCHCELWSSYIEKHDRAEYLPQFVSHRSRRAAFRVTMKKEMDQLTRLANLYESTPSQLSFSQFKKKLQKLIDSQSLNIL